MPTKQPSRSRVVLTDISSRTWEHPADRGALVALRRLKGFDTVVKAMSGLVSERAVRLVYLGSAIRADEYQFVRLHRLLNDAGTTLDVAQLPELFVTANPVPNALTIGMRKPIIVVTSGLVELMDDEEMRFVLAHELGHAVSGHAVYQTLLQRLIQVSGGHLEDLDHTAFFAQGAEYDASDDVRDRLHGRPRGHLPAPCGGRRGQGQRGGPGGGCVVHRDVPALPGPAGQGTARDGRRGRLDEGLAGRQVPARGLTAALASQSARWVRVTTSGWSEILRSTDDVSTVSVVDRAWPARKIQSTQ